MKKLMLTAALTLATGFAQADSPILVDPHRGKYLGNLNSNPFDPNSVSNEFGRYGSEFSQDSINNEFGPYGSPFGEHSVNNPYSTGPAIIHPGNGYGWH